MAAYVAVLTAVTRYCGSYNLTIFFLPPPLFLPLASVGDSCEGINMLGFCASGWLEMPLLCT